MDEGARRCRGLSQELHDAEAGGIPLLLLFEAGCLDVADGQLVHRPRFRAGRQGRSARGLPARHHAISGDGWRGLQPVQDLGHRRQLRHQRREQAQGHRGRVSQCDVDARDGQDVDRDGLPADRHQGRREILQWPSRRLFHRADGTTEGSGLFHRRTARLGSGHVQGQLRAGAEQRLPRRTADGGADGEDDERRVLQGLSEEERAHVTVLARRARLWGRREPGAEVSARRAAPATLFIFLAPALLLYAVFTVYPVLRTFWNSIHTIGPHNVQELVGAANFTQLLTADRVFWKAVGNTAIFTVVATIADVLGGLLLALCLFSGAPMAKLLRVVWFTPVLMSYVVVGIIWVWIYDYDWGLANFILRSVGLGAFEQSWLGDPRTALWSVMATHVWKWLGFNMIVFLAALYALPGEVLGAAALDNCGWLAKLVYIIIPMLRPTIVNLL